jgi:Peptidase M15
MDQTSSSSNFGSLLSPFAEASDEASLRPLLRADVFACCREHGDAGTSESFESDSYESDSFESAGYGTDEYETDEYETDEYETGGVPAPVYWFEDEGSDGEALADEWFADGSSEDESSGDEWLEDEWFEEAARTTYSEPFPCGLVLRTVALPTGPRDPHHDPNGVNLALYDTNPSLHRKKLSRNFTVGELVTTGGRKSEVARISHDLVRGLQALRDHLGREISITSGYRSNSRNAAVYGARKKKPTLSRHSSGQAVDVKVAGMTGIQIAKAAIDVLGTNIGVGVGANFAHIDVRGTWARWTYFKAGSSAQRDAIRELDRHRAAKLRSSETVKPALLHEGGRSIPSVSSTSRLSVNRHPLLAGHVGTQPNLILRWNTVPTNGVVDVVVHFHGYSSRKAAMKLVDKERNSGLDFVDPVHRPSGRTTPTLGIIPRGNNNANQGGNGYDFRALAQPGAMAALIDDSLHRFGAATGVPVTRGRLILTAHSGGGSALMRALSQVDPDEVHVFDALYGVPRRNRPDPIAPLLSWARARIKSARASTRDQSALRVIHLGSTKANSMRLHEFLCAELEGAQSDVRRRFRVERSAPNIDHFEIPRTYGWRLLANAGGDLPDVATHPCVSPATQRWFESSADFERDLDDESLNDDFEDEDFLDESFVNDEFVDEFVDEEFTAGFVDTASSAGRDDVRRGHVDAFVDEFFDDTVAEDGEGFGGVFEDDFDGGASDFGELEMERAADPCADAEVVHAKPADPPATALGSLVVDAAGRRPFRYQFTREDLIWTAKLIVHEAGGDDDAENAAVLWAMFNRYALFTHTTYRSFTSFIRRYSTTLQPVLANPRAAERHAHKGDRVYRKTGGVYPGTDIPKGQLIRHLQIQAAPWEKIKPSARQVASRALRGDLPNPGIGLASEFASTYVYYRQRHGRSPSPAQWLDYTAKFAAQKKWSFVGDVPGIDPTKNAFFVQNSVKQLPPTAVRIIV